MEMNQRLSAERQLYEQTKKELNQNIREQKDIHDKENREAQLRVNSLSQQYKILNTKNDDLEIHCQTVKKELATTNDGLKSQLSKVQGQLAKVQTSKDNDIAMWRVSLVMSSTNANVTDRLRGVLGKV